MQWKLFADLAEAAGAKEIDVDAEPGVTVGDALDDLLDAHPALAERVLEDGDLHDHINILRNGTNVMVQEDGLKTNVEAGDELAMFPPVSGG